MVAVWQRERADGSGYGTRGGCWRLALTTYRRSAAERRRGGRWRGEDPQVCVRNMGIRIVKVGALEVGHDFSNALLQRLWQISWGHYNY